MNDSVRPAVHSDDRNNILPLTVKASNAPFLVHPREAINSIVSENPVDQEKIERCAIVSVVLSDFFYPEDGESLNLSKLLMPRERDSILDAMVATSNGSDYSKMAVNALVPLIETTRNRLFAGLSEYLQEKKTAKWKMGRILGRLEKLSEGLPGWAERHLQRGFNTAFIEFFNSLYLIPLVFYREEGTMISPAEFRDIAINQEKSSLLLASLNSDVFLPFFQDMYPIMGFMPDSHDFSIGKSMLHFSWKTSVTSSEAGGGSEENNPRFGCPALYVRDAEHGNLITALWRNLVSECETLFFPYLEKTVIR